MTQPAFTKMYLKGKQPLFGYTVNSNGTEAAVAQAQPARRPAQWKRPRTKAPACGRGVARTTLLRAVGAKAPRKKANGHVEAAAETWLGVVFFILRRCEPPSCSWWRGKRLAG